MSRAGYGLISISLLLRVVFESLRALTIFFWPGATEVGFGVALEKRDEITSNSFSYFTRPEKDKPSVVKAASLRPSVFRMPLVRRGFPKEKRLRPELQPLSLSRRR